MLTPLGGATKYIFLPAFSPLYNSVMNSLCHDPTIGDETFGYDRYLNQILYQSSEWRRFRRNIVIRDNGCDLATPGYEIQGKILIHHINPITLRDIEQRDPKVFDPENVISTSLLTHNAIHYGDESILITEPIERRPNDTCPWKR